MSFSLKNLNPFSSRKKDLLGCLINCFENNCPWLYKRGIPDEFLKQLVELVNSENLVYVQAKNKNKIGNGLSNKKIYNTGDLLDHQKFYEQCDQFNINDWYVYFKNKYKNDRIIYYPPDHFWGYLGLLFKIFALNYLTNNKINETDEILSKWQNQIMDLLDNNFVKNNNLYFFEESFNQQKVSENQNPESNIIKIDIKNISFSWFLRIAPFLKPFPRDKLINEMILNLNLNGVVWSRIIETAANMVQLKEQDDGLSNIRFGGSGVYDDIYYNQYELRKSMIKSMLYLQKHACIQYFTDLHPDLYHDTEIYLNDKIFYKIHMRFYYEYCHRGELLNLINQVTNLEHEIADLKNEKKSLHYKIESVTQELIANKSKSDVVSAAVNYKEDLLTEIKNQIRNIDNTIDI